MSDALAYRVGSHDLVPYDRDDDWTRDPRGLIIMYEKPSPHATYIVGCDPTVGITGWHRDLRTRDDAKKDNGVVEVVRCGRGGGPDVQVAEYAAPVDPEDLAPIVNLLGRMYAGDNEDGMAQVIIEVYPGPGLLTQNALINKYAYGNVFIWKYLDERLPRQSIKLGWYSSRDSRRALWLRGMRHMNLRKFTPRSPYLVEEMVDCVEDNFLSFTARAKYGSHDDRVVATLLAIWAANEWSMQYDPQETVVEEQGKPEYQRSDMSAEAMFNDWNDRFSRMVDD